MTDDPTTRSMPPSDHPSVPSPEPASFQLAPGDRVGNYVIREQIGEGGFAIVYAAEQERPVRRKVALKIIKLGMDTKQVIARFEAERQALAMMDHPNVATVFDAGSTDAGRPYFVMEYVAGTPINEYCDRQRLTIEERLGLFIQVCEAVQHAHQKGIIHRDIKPSNVLVAVKEGEPQVKVIDFGVAKAITQRLTEKTIYTEQGQLIGTPEYMSPEQAEMTQDDIDTRTDIYSLGVMLYELLTGVLPFDPTTLRQAAFGEIQRIIREQEPLIPSTRVSIHGEGSTSTAQHRRIDAKSLMRELRGDLDWIVMMALEKDRSRRYPTSSELAKDIHRHLHDEPIQASPPGAIYSVRKFIRRHRAGVVATGGIFAVTVGLSVSGLSFVWAGAMAAKASAVVARAEANAAAADARAAREETLSNAIVNNAKDGSWKHNQRQFAAMDLMPVLWFDIGFALTEGGVSLAGQCRYVEAELALQLAFELLSAAHGTNDGETEEAARALADLYDAWGKPEKAAEWRAKLPTEQDAVASDPPADGKQDEESSGD